MKKLLLLLLLGATTTSAEDKSSELTVSKVSYYTVKVRKPKAGDQFCLDGKKMMRAEVPGKPEPVVMYVLDKQGNTIACENEK